MKTQLGYLRDCSPSLYFVTDSSMRMGYATKIYEIINAEMPHSSGVIFVDPYIDYKQVMDALMPTNAMKIYEMKLNLNSTFPELAQIFARTNCETIVLPDMYKDSEDIHILGNYKKKKFYSDDCLLDLGMKRGDYCWMKPGDAASIHPKKIDRLMDRLGVDRRGEYEGCSMDVIDGGFKIENGKLIGFKLESKSKERDGFLVIGNFFLHSDF